MLFISTATGSRSGSRIESGSRKKSGSRNDDALSNYFKVYFSSLKAKLVELNNIFKTEYFSRCYAFQVIRIGF